VIELATVRDGAREQVATMFSTSWMAAARQVLTLMTSWSLPDDLVDYAARVLRVRALLHQSMTSLDLDGRLSAYEAEHATAARGRPWMSSEYATVLESPQGDGYTVATVVSVLD